MFKNDIDQEHSPVPNFVPGFAFYDDVSNRLAEAIVNLFERVADSFRGTKM